MKGKKKDILSRWVHASEKIEKLPTKQWVCNGTRLEKRVATETIGKSIHG